MTKQPAKQQGYTLDLASGIETVPLTINDPEGNAMRFRIPVLNDKIKALRIQKMNGFTTDVQVVNWMVELLYKAAEEGVSEAQIRAAITHEETTESARAQILGLLLTGRWTDPKLHGQLLSKLTTKMLDKLVAAI